MRRGNFEDTNPYCGLVLYPVENEQILEAQNLNNTYSYIGRLYQTFPVSTAKILYV